MDPPMPQVERTTLKERLTAPASLLIVGLVTAIVLTLAPSRWTNSLKSVAATSLRPAQLAVLWMRDAAASATNGARRHFNTSDRLAQAEQEIQRLENDNRLLRAELAVAMARPSESPAGPEAGQPEPLLAAQYVRARVLGYQARAFLDRHALLDVGGESGVEPDALALAVPQGLIDQGTNAGLDAGRLVISQGHVWGKTVNVGPHLSSVLMVTEPGYRDVVRLATPATSGQPARLGPEGILEGTGQPFARIRLVKVTEPVSVDDLVFSSAGRGVTPTPALYGRVVRVDRRGGESCWEIWMAPAAASEVVEEVVVLQTVLHSDAIR